MQRSEKVRWAQYRAHHRHITGTRHITGGYTIGWHNTGFLTTSYAQQHVIYMCTDVKKIFTVVKKESTTTAIFEYSKYKTFKTVQGSEEVKWVLTGWGDGS